MNEHDRWGSPEARREQILSRLSEQDRTTVSELSQALGVSEVTVRKDLDQLEAQGMITRIHGGAVFSGRGRLELYFNAREQIKREEKRRIAAAAASLVVSGQTIFLDASTTAFQLARLLKDRRNLTVVTNGLYTALELTFVPDIRVVVVGGVVRRRSSSLVGGLSYDLLRRLHVDIGFFGARGVTARAGLTEADLDEAQLKQHMVEASATVVGILDSSKWGEAHLSSFALPVDIDRIISDSDAPEAGVQELRALDIVVELV